MALNQRLDLRHSQTLVMTPQLQQAIRLLQYSNLELNAFIETQLQENPLLERHNDDDAADAPPQMADAVATPRDTADVVREDGNFDQSLDSTDTDYANVWDDGSGGRESGLVWSDGGGGGSAGGDGDSPGWESFTATPVSLRDHLMNQVHLEFSDPVEQMIATAIIDDFDDAGYFTGDFATLAGQTGVDTNTVAWVHSRILRFDPVGIGARSLAECLRLQLAERGEMSPELEALLNHLPLLAKRDFKTLARRCGVDLGALGGLIETLRSCAPRPAAGFDDTPAVTVIPDVLVRRGGKGGWIVELNQDALPRVLANRDYYAFVRSSARSQADIDFVVGQWQAANWLTKALEQRANTILKVATAIVRQQERFLEEGVTGLRPMTMHEVAEEVGVHESTVSRVSNGKYMATPQGVLELKSFFTAGAGAVGGTESQSVEAVRHRIRQLIEAETAKSVLSDENLVELLRADGIELARRTVAKYREAMNIPSSAQRRRVLRLAAS
ncbi:MAG: RNA polymerase factor sigma-54 [Alphaproteobacteria bacterium]|nr:RNA polymerase factor sigma-54 [Alphaproteobacteria bacterium]MCB9930677.1 RNA polymerase factor sigma-54 [Alphaproteobacteria bacterium]